MRRSCAQSHDYLGCNMYRDHTAIGSSHIRLRYRNRCPLNGESPRVKHMQQLLLRPPTGHKCTCRLRMDCIQTAAEKLSLGARNMVTAISTATRQESYYYYNGDVEAGRDQRARRIERRQAFPTQFPTCTDHTDCAYGQFCYVNGICQPGKPIPVLSFPTMASC